ncbi:suppressor of fused domain protein [Motilimonas sp. E26]|uniref:suppressor of fused domain protein n=1 Tax=Motilimonas sp. E26 TaxID=2865674 RepID=UPI001E380917|nr:suppressor of fused domain protein [Motilimonas sp. E26]MCE0559244.1 suppressor of fused domain protein [Motilimonas sp. E26]
MTTATKNSIEVLLGSLQATEFKPDIPFELGGDQPLDMIAAYKMSDPEAHWLFLTTGFKKYGFELSFRVKSDDEMAPMWAVEFIKSLAKFAFNRDNGFVVGDMVAINRPLVSFVDCFLDTVLFVEDPAIEALEDGGDSIEFIQIMPITADEAMAARSWTMEKFMQVLSYQTPAGLVDLGRFSILKNENIAQAIRRGAENDGSDTECVPCGKILFNVSDASSAYIEIDALAAEYLLAILPGRIPHGRSIEVISPEHNVKLMAGDEGMIRGVSDSWVEITLTPNMYNQMMENLQLKRKRFFFDEFENVSFSVNDYYIKDMENRTVGVKQWR